MNILDLKVGQSIDWKFGISTRDVYRASEDKFEITDTSSGWYVALVSFETLEKLLKGELSLLDLDWV